MDMETQSSDLGLMFLQIFSDHGVVIRLKLRVGDEERVSQFLYL